ncbi:MAG: hypothetical protein ABII12_03145 [Planctomycetota bacterium]
MSNPLAEIDAIVAAALTEFEPLTAVVPVGRIQLWDRAVDIRGEVEEASDMGCRIWIVPMDSDPNLPWSSGSARFDRNYDIGFGVGNLLLPQLRGIEWLIYKALARLFELKRADGATPIANPVPFQIESFVPTRSDPERGPLVSDPQEWTDLIGVKATVVTARSNLLT